MEIRKTNILRTYLHEEIIKKLVQLYGNEKWKYTFIKNAKEKFDQRIQYKQLNKFEDGKQTGEYILLTLFLEIVSYENEFSLELYKDKQRLVCKIK